MGVLKKLFGDTSLYRFALWLQQEHHNDQIRIYRPDQFAHFGAGVKIESDVLITHPQHVVLKDRVLVHSGTFVNSVGGLHVGENTGIGYNCSIFTAQHHYRNAASIPFDNVGELKPVIIREFVWIGANAMILPGIEIGEGSIIGMGAVITKSVPPLAIVLGNPAEIVMYRDKEHYFKCKSENRIQVASIEQYEYKMVEMYKRKYHKELQEMGLL